MVATTERVKTSLARLVHSWLTRGGQAVERYLEANSIQDRHLSAMMAGRDECRVVAAPREGAVL